jgi:hypothetical protein
LRQFVATSKRSSHSVAEDFDLDLGPAIREALLAATQIAAHLSVYDGSPAVFTRRPVPSEADYPLIIVNDPVAITDEDGLTSDRPLWGPGDIAIYGRKATPGTVEDHTRLVQQLGIRTRLLFHRQKWALQVGGFHVIDIRASGPVPAPVDDDKTIGRIVSLLVRLGRVS